jgi:hypothetical protein
MDPEGMAKTNAEKVRASEKKRLDRGEMAIKVWVPDTPEAKAAVRQVAARL